MQDGASISGNEASAWLREHFADKPERKVNITWRDEEPISDAAQRRILEILFTPRAGSPSA
ncbi:hypothetical protein [Streptomyces formicae]|uniref:Uncharacterized protein n=1 Tax=Streptomyces formicae TaxID=1616117 RepID=A0ABY3WID1_9ACTN|nr:hypothetical protein [Streptomyces formicae]UNM12359.1 hypothetical protein J4032_13140 [Streptomyces formicae]